MTDTPSSILLLRLQSTGSNTNLWGGYLNTALQTLEQADKGYQTYTVTGDATIGWTNYATGNIGQSARLKLIGSPAATAALTLPSNMNFISIENGTLVSVTIKCSGGTGVSIAAGERALLYCDGVDYYNAGPTLFPTGDITVAGKIRSLTAGTANADAVNLVQMNNAIAAAIAGVTADGTFYLTYIYEMSGGETSVSGPDDSGNTLAYTPGFVDVYLNGVLQSTGGADPDITASTGTSITFDEALSAGDIVEIHAWNVFSVANTYTQSQVNALFGAPPVGIGSVTPASVTATTLTVTAGGATIAGNSTITGTFGVSGIARFGTGLTNHITANGSGTNPTLGTSAGNLLVAPAGITTMDIRSVASANRNFIFVASNSGNCIASVNDGAWNFDCNVVYTSQTVGTTVGAAGGASALPATPLGYWTRTINGTVVKIPYYNT